MACISLQVSDGGSNKLAGIMLASMYKALLSNTYLILKLMFKIVGHISEIYYK